MLFHGFDLIPPRPRQRKGTLTKVTTVRILVTGAAGKVGQVLLPLLRHSFPLRLTDLRAIPTALPEDEVLEGDLADPEFAVRAVSGAAGVVHLAGLVASDVSFEDTLNGNYRALLSILEACRAQSVRRFIFTSSHHILGLHPAVRLYDETSPLAPDGFYGLSKAFGEAACAMYALRFGIATLVIRVGNADPRVADARRERLWISGRDLCQLVTIGLTHEALRYEIVNGVSYSPSPLFSLDSARRLGYLPEDNSCDYRATDFRTAAEMTEADSSYAGGRFAVDSLPHPFRQG
jgi:uronate dehydrogenase